MHGQHNIKTFPGVKRLGREVNHSPVSSALIKNEGSYTSHPSIYLHGVYKVNLTFVYPGHILL
jgi:hypothetical protein